MRQRFAMAFALVALVLTAMLPSVATATEAEVKASCKHGGWQQLVREDGSAFRNQGACVSYAARGGTPVPPDPLQAVCDAAGGTLEDVTPTLTVFNLVCSVPQLSESEFTAFASSFRPICFAYPGAIGTITNTSGRTINCFGERT